MITCNFPKTRVQTNKSQFDRLQILLNDLTIWQQKFSIIDDHDNNQNKSTNDIGFMDNNGTSIHDSEDFGTRKKSESKSFRAHGDTNMSLKPSFASLVIFMTNGLCL